MIRAERPRVLMAVFNALDFDGRVQRAATALADMADVEVLAIDGGRGFSPSAAYRLNVMPVTPGEFGSNRMLHLRFLHKLVSRACQLRPHLLYAHDFFLAFPGWVAARLSGARFVYDAHELIIPGSLGRHHSQFQEKVWYWLERSKRGVPAEFAPKIEEATGVLRSELRPDLWPESLPAGHASDRTYSATAP